jgi:hypothetical protein
MKTFLDHLYFSLVSTLVGLIALYLVLYVVDGALTQIGMSFGFRNFSVGASILALTIVWVLASSRLACFLTYRTVKNRPRDQIVYTKRQK